MAHLIDKDALIAEIERRRRDWRYGSSIEAKFKREECDDILSFLDTLEVKEVDNEQLNRLLNWWKEVTTEHSAYKAKEVDLDKELNKYFITNNLIAADIQFEPVTQMKKCAKYFFELGISVGNKTNKIE